MQKKNTQKSKWWAPILAPFRLLWIEKIYFTWVFILLISYAGCFVDLLNGEIGDSLPKGILYSTSFAVLAPFTIEFSVDYLNIRRSGRKEMFSGYKAWALVICSVSIFTLLILYATNAKSNVWLQVILTVFVSVLSFYTHLISKMEDHPQLFYDCVDVPYDIAEKRIVEELCAQANEVTSVNNGSGKEVKL